MQKADYRENLINQVTNELESNKFASRSKNGFEGVFTRVRKLSFSRLIIFIMSTSRAIQRELDDFLKKINNENFSIREVTKSAFTQARAKLNPWAFVRLNEVTVEGFYETAEYYVWRGMRLLAVDGTRLVLPNHPSVVKEYGLYGMGPNGGSQKSMALASMLYDVLNQVTIDAQIAPYKESEISLLHKHLPKLKKNGNLSKHNGRTQPATDIWRIAMN